MIDLKQQIEEYLHFCKNHKRLNYQTIKAYSIDLRQYEQFMKPQKMTTPMSKDLNSYIMALHNKYQPKTVKRKIASLKAFSKYLIYYKGFSDDLFFRINTKFCEPKKLPKTIELHVISDFIQAMYNESILAKNDYQKKNIIRDIAVTELLFGTGIRVSELCSLKVADIDLISRTVKIFGKGAKERILTIGSNNLIESLKKYAALFSKKRPNYNFFFINKLGKKMSEQSVRSMLKKYAKIAGISQHITPHMFRHSFATLLLEQDVDIRYIQKMLGHSSITVTEIYTYVSNAKQRDILIHKNPRNLIHFSM